MGHDIQARFESKFLVTPGCWEWTAGKFPSGYGQFWLNGTQKTAHRISYQLYVGHIPDDLFVCHHCDHDGCVNPDHLFLGTQLDNMEDMRKKGRMGRRGWVFRLPGHAQGVKNAARKLTEAQVLAIRDDSRSQQSIADDYGVTQVCISEITRRKTWAHLR